MMVRIIGMQRTHKVVTTGQIIMVSITSKAMTKTYQVEMV